MPGTIVAVGGEDIAHVTLTEQGYRRLLDRGDDRLDPATSHAQLKSGYVGTLTGVRLRCENAFEVFTAWESDSASAPLPWN